ncbi:MAG: hypothetical protein OEW83_18175 [Acidimicrobiia bacterium]|nr:hypothetical protein [Acidimicrobiia bacterium]
MTETRTTLRRGFSVAFVGPDGAGKTTVARRLETELPLPVTYLYMGVSAESSNRLLPTTRLIRSIRRRKGVVERGPKARTAESVDRPSLRRRLRAAARLLNRVAEESYRQAIASREMRQGRIVLFDRHFFADYHMHDIDTDGRLPLSRRLHGLFISRVLARPDLLVFLDVPAEVLFARKGEGTIELLDEMREGYRRLSSAGPSFVTLDGDRPLDDVVADAVAVVLAHAEASNSR